MNTATLYNDEATLYRLYIGKNDRYTGKQELSNEYIVGRINTVLAENKVDGYTLLEATGYWKSKPEETIVVEIVETYRPEIVMDCIVKGMVSILKLNLNQESIMVTKQSINVAF